MVIEPAQRHGIDIVPPAIHASVGHLPGQPPGQPDAPAQSPFEAFLTDGNLLLWRPGLADIAKALGWRWLLMGPCLLAVLWPLPGMIFLNWHAVMFLGIYTIKLWILALGVAITLWIWGVRNAVRRRTDIFCVHCGYSLENAESTGTCPECGARFIPGICEEYCKDPAFFRHRMKALRNLPRSTSVMAGSTSDSDPDNKSLGVTKPPAA